MNPFTPEEIARAEFEALAAKDAEIERLRQENRAIKSRHDQAVRTAVIAEREKIG